MRLQIRVFFIPDSWKSFIKNTPLSPVISKELQGTPSSGIFNTISPGSRTRKTLDSELRPWKSKRGHQNPGKAPTHYSCIRRSDALSFDSLLYIYTNYIYTNSQMHGKLILCTIESINVVRNARIRKRTLWSGIHRFSSFLHEIKQLSCTINCASKKEKIKR